MVTSILSKTSKMPCLSISLDARLCNTGGVLAKIPNTPCNKCYALRGFYNMPYTRDAMEERLKMMTSAKFIPRMVRLLKDEHYFRWFDSGDIQSEKMGHDILTIAEQTPKVRHWLPSKEYKWWRNITRERPIPSNVTLRISTPVDDRPPIPRWNYTSTTYTYEASPAIAGFRCIAHENKETYGKYECGTCRACWNPGINNIAYPKRYESKGI